MKYAVEMASVGLIYIPNFMMNGSDIQVILKLLPQQFERLQCWYCRWYEFMKYAVEMASDGIVLHIHTKFHDDRFRHSSNIKLITSTV
jgi:hypothetical protein